MGTTDDYCTHSCDHNIVTLLENIVISGIRGAAVRGMAGNYLTPKRRRHEADRAAGRRVFGVLPPARRRKSSFAAILLLESAPQESFTAIHENLPYLPASLFRLR